MSSGFNLDVMRTHLAALRDLGPEGLAARLPAVPGLPFNGYQLVAALTRLLAVLDAMTPDERADPARIDGPAAQRIAAAAGADPGEVEQLVQRFRQRRPPAGWELIAPTIGLTWFGKPPE